MRIKGQVDFDPQALVRFLAARFGPQDGNVGIERIGGGQSNPSYFLDYGPRRFVLRKQPDGPILRGAHAIDREYRVLETLFPTPVPVPRPVLFHDDPGLLGTPFYLMDRVEGRVFTDTGLAGLAAAERKPIWMAVADTMAAMHAIRRHKARDMATCHDPAPLMPFHKAFALYRFAVIFVGIADRARSESATDPKAAKLAPLAVRFAMRGLEVASGRPHVMPVPSRL